MFVHLSLSSQSLWDILATIVHLGNVTFKENSKGHAEFGSSEQLECIAKVRTMCVCAFDVVFTVLSVLLCVCVL